MRIAHVVPKHEQPWSGVLTVIVDLAAALARRGHHVEVWQTHAWLPRVYADQRERLRAANVIEVAAASVTRRGGADALVREHRIDVVHLHGAFNTTNTAVSRRIHRPFVFSPHSGYDRISLRRGRGRKLVYRVLFERAMLDRAALVVALTEAELGDVRRFGATGPAEVIPNGVRRAPEGLDREAFRTTLGLGREDALALFVGRLDVYRKGLDVVVRGVAQAPGWHLALIGPRFRDVDRLESLVTDLGVNERIHPVGECHGRALLESIAAADVFTLLSRWEGLPMSLLEALSLSVPAIVSPAVERAIGVEAGGAGWVAEDHDALGDRLRALGRGDAVELTRRRDAALALSRRYDWADVAQRYEAAYERAIEMHRPVRS
jgi:glycosyltransferase involved in cell wall biosynthesis